MRELTMKPVFLSYSRKNVEDVQEIANILCAGGIKIWQDVESLSIGNTENQIRKAINEECAAFFFYVTEESVNSEFIREQVALFGRAENPILADSALVSYRSIRCILFQADIAKVKVTALIDSAEKPIHRRPMRIKRFKGILKAQVFLMGVGGGKLKSKRS